MAGHHIFSHSLRGQAAHASGPGIARSPHGRLLPGVCEIKYHSAHMGESPDTCPPHPHSAMLPAEATAGARGWYFISLSHCRWPPRLHQHCSSGGGGAAAPAGLQSGTLFRKHRTLWRMRRGDPLCWCGRARARLPDYAAARLPTACRKAGSQRCRQHGSQCPLWPVCARGRCACTWQGSRLFAPLP